MMLNALLTWFRRPSRPAQAPVGGGLIARFRRPSRPLQEPVGNDLVAWTCADAEGHPACPDCGCARFRHGPEGGGCVNVFCAGCGAGFNVAMIPGSPLIQRISRRDPSVVVSAHERAAHERWRAENVAPPLGLSCP